MKECEITGPDQTDWGQNVVGHPARWAETTGEGLGQPPGGGLHPEQRIGHGVPELLAGVPRLWGPETAEKTVRRTAVCLCLNECVGEYGVDGS